METSIQEEEEEKYWSTVYVLDEWLSMRRAEKTQQPKKKKRRKIIEEDNSKESLELYLQWINKIRSLEDIIGNDDIVEKCSKPMRKQLTESDVKEDQNRLMLGKLQMENMKTDLLNESDIPQAPILNGLEVYVYGPDGDVHVMMFKLWNQKTPVLTSGWNKFVAKYGLEKYRDFLTIWMFRHKKNGKICFVIDSTKISITKQLSRRILNFASRVSN